MQVCARNLPDLVFGLWGLGLLPKSILVELAPARNNQAEVARQQGITMSAAKQF